MTGTGGALRPLERNRFFYGKVMDVRQFQMEQGYAKGARQLLSRLGLGIGVLTGLDVELSDDATAASVRSGVAIDALGRTIVVPADVVVRSPQQPTDHRGTPDGDPVTDGVVALVLCYHECLTEPVSAIACGCDTVSRCEPGVVCERYALRLVRGLPEEVGPVACPAMFPADPAEGFDRRRAVFETLSEAPVPASLSAEDTPDCRVTLATFTFSPDHPATVDPFTYRPVIYSNQALFELIMCLAARVDECCRTHTEPASPPRVMRMWPSDGTVLAAGPAAERDHWLKDPRIEIAFERTIPDAVLDRPEDWLRAWSFVLRRGEVFARRIRLARESGGRPPVLAPVGAEQVALYRLDEQYRRDIRVARVLVQLRPGDGGAPVVVDTSVPPVLLDGEYHGTDLGPAALDTLWTSIGDVEQVVQPSWWDALLAGAAPPLPSGDGSPGGSLDAGFAFLRLEPPPDQPKLLAIWPPNAAFLRRGTDDEVIRRWQADFREQPHLELTFEPTIDDNALAALLVDDWIRLWWLPQQDHGQAVVRRLRLSWHGKWAAPHLAVPGTTVALNIDLPLDELQPDGPNHFVWVLRGDNAAVDADFEGVTVDGRLVDPPGVDALWNLEQWPSGSLSGPASEGARLADGVPGGTLSAYFDFAKNA